LNKSGESSPGDSMPLNPARTSSSAFLRFAGSERFMLGGLQKQWKRYRKAVSKVSWGCLLLMKESARKGSTVIPETIMSAGGRRWDNPTRSSERVPSYLQPYAALAGSVHGGLLPDPLLMAPRKTGWYLDSV